MNEDTRADAAHQAIEGKSGSEFFDSTTEQKSTVHFDLAKCAASSTSAQSTFSSDSIDPVQSELSNGAWASFGGGAIMELVPDSDACDALLKLFTKVVAAVHKQSLELLIAKRSAELLGKRNKVLRRMLDEREVSLAKAQAEVKARGKLLDSSVIRLKTLAASHTTKVDALQQLSETKSILERALAERSGLQASNALVRRLNQSLTKELAEANLAHQATKQSLKQIKEELKSIKQQQGARGRKAKKNNSKTTKSTRKAKDKTQLDTLHSKTISCKKRPLPFETKLISAVTSQLESSECDNSHQPLLLDSNSKAAKLETNLNEPFGLGKRINLVARLGRSNSDSDSVTATCGKQTMESEDSDNREPDLSHVPAS